jgi:hypothetical protein
MLAVKVERVGPILLGHKCWKMTLKLLENLINLAQLKVLA